MNPPKCDELEYIHFLIASPKYFTCTEAARCQPDGENTPAHDAFNRLLQRQPHNTEALWQEAKGLINPKSGILVLDDTTLDKPYANKMDLVTYHWSGKHHRVVKGINLLTLLWTEKDGLLIPCDARIYDKPQGGKTKNEYFKEMLEKAKERGFQPKYVLFDSWYSSIENLKTVRRLEWYFLSRLKDNRLVNPDGKGNVSINTVEIPPEGRIVHLREFGFVKVFRTVSREGEAEYWVTNDCSMTEINRTDLEKQGWGIETYHRGLKQCCGAERSQVQKAEAIIAHLLFSIRAFLRLEVHRKATGISWYEAKTDIIREAVRAYLANPLFILNPTA
jgi:putative transposase